MRGTPNKVTVEAKAAAAALVDDPVYRAKLAADLRLRKVHPSIESMLWYYAKGKPKETVEHQASVVDAQIEADRQLPTEVLRKMSAAVDAVLKEAGFA
jgi:hypothetical protein